MPHPSIFSLMAARRERTGRKKDSPPDECGLGPMLQAGIGLRGLPGTSSQQRDAHNPRARPISPVTGYRLDVYGQDGIKSGLTATEHSTTKTLSNARRGRICRQSHRHCGNTETTPNQIIALFACFETPQDSPDSSPAPAPCSPPTTHRPVVLSPAQPTTSQR
ncbi:uncharacterized protein QC763_0032640 [Podospora pseudopauciseta]|uniref:Uncharacterized protein n=1 Tax=Podospora pseudopauciseta TaxID=2093780 RepID=A0ABR0HN02_9PEZI|nr:hypothetical protein QC763_0032640 [Podospora pseudopauciseta]